MRGYVNYHNISPDSAVRADRNKAVAGDQADCDPSGCCRLVFTGIPEPGASRKINEQRDARLAHLTRHCSLAFLWEDVGTQQLQSLLASIFRHSLELNRHFISSFT